MLPIKQVFVSALCLATMAAAMPSPEVPAGKVVLLETEVDNGILTVYGDAVTEKRQVEPLNPRACGDNNVQCSSSHTADPNTCQQLINSIRGNGNGIPSSPRDICFSNSGGRCCVSWANPVSGAAVRDLTNAAQKTLNICRSGNIISGLSRDTRIGGTCTTQCLSNRPNGCN